MARPSLKEEILKLMREYTQDRSHSFAHSRIVESNSQLKAILLTTQEGTKMKDLTNAPSATQNL